MPPSGQPGHGQHRLAGVEFPRVDVDHPGPAGSLGSPQAAGRQRTGNSLRYPPPPTGTFHPAIRRTSGGISRIRPPPGPRAQWAHRGTPGTPYRSCRIGKMEESYWNPVSASTSSAQDVRVVTEKVGARKPMTCRPPRSSRRLRLSISSPRNSWGVMPWSIRWESNCECNRVMP